MVEDDGDGHRCCDGREVGTIGVAKGTSLVGMEGNALGRQWREWPLVLVRQAWLSGFGVRSPPRGGKALLQTTFFAFEETEPWAWRFLSDENIYFYDGVLEWMGMRVWALRMRLTGWRKGVGVEETRKDVVESPPLRQLTVSLLDLFLGTGAGDALNDGSWIESPCHGEHRTAQESW